MPGCAGAVAATPTRRPVPRTRPPSREGPIGAALRRAGLRRPVVLAVEEAIDAFVDASQEFVSGEVRVRCGRGAASSSAAAANRACTTTAWPPTTRPTPFRHQDAEGFVRLWGLACRRPPAVTARKVTSGRAASATARPTAAGLHRQPVLRQRLAFDDLAGRVPMSGPGPRRHPPRRRVAHPAGRPRPRGIGDTPPGPSSSNPADEANPHRIERGSRRSRGRWAPNCTPYVVATTRCRRPCVVRQRELRLVAERTLALNTGCLIAPSPPRRLPRPGTRTCTGATRAAGPTTCWPTAGPWPATSTACSPPFVAAMSRSPLGAGALAGSSLALDPTTPRRTGLRRTLRQLARCRQRRDFVAEGLFEPGPLGCSLRGWARRSCCVDRGVRLPGSTDAYATQFDVSAEKNPRRVPSWPGARPSSHRPPHRRLTC